ncbi:MAG TPA: YaaL family protein [Methylomusa anaerophila]|uniref:DUF2508 domain-containing protein n=1 Tax=Methylomusa anaerophila TaxID=1930071 RepID=A0A348AIF3_9FIRM|nr:YaaL family protein [Methylomusa anaerophila]BBB90851.1 hypothetical protein MAMMFC1_01515 [Methylomusa anaerophila]HML90645.1 YaaL family protein [Methylomusa anaerophila]
MWSNFLRILSWGSEGSEHKIMDSLSVVVEQARQEWLYAQTLYDIVTDPDLIDHAAYLIKATEKKYIYLLRKARHEGVCRSPAQHFAVQNGMVRRGC